MVVARVEAFIAGWDCAEALKRAEAYVDAGADAILMHSKKGMLHVRCFDLPRVAALRKADHAGTCARAAHVPSTAVRF